MVEVWAADHERLRWGGDKPREELLCDGGPEGWMRGMFKDIVRVKFQPIDPSL